MKPVCVPCQRFFRPKKNGFYFTECMPVIAGALPGKMAPENWKPYKLWSGDLWKCEGCGTEIVNGVGRGPIREHFEGDFHKVTADLNADQLRVNDC